MAISSSSWGVSHSTLKALSLQRGLHRIVSQQNPLPGVQVHGGRVEFVVDTMSESDRRWPRIGFLVALLFVFIVSALTCKGAAYVLWLQGESHSFWGNASLGFAFGALLSFVGVFILAPDPRPTYERIKNLRSNLMLFFVSIALIMLGTILFLVW
jgi:amino acid transporter